MIDRSFYTEALNGIAPFNFLKANAKKLFDLIEVEVYK